MYEATELITAWEDPATNEFEETIPYFLPPTCHPSLNDMTVELTDQPAQMVKYYVSNLSSRVPLPRT